MAETVAVAPGHRNRHPLRDYAARPMARADAPRLSVVIPTRGRPSILNETLERLVAFAPEAPIEVLVVHDGSSPETAEVAGRARAGAGWPVRALVEEARGPARKRNLAIAEARAPVCLMIGDDALPTRTLVDGHLAFHDRRADGTAAMLGLVVPAPPLDRAPFVRWLHEHGTQFHYAALEPHEEVGPARFWTANISVKTALLRDSGGFDDAFGLAAAEDIELGFRLARAGMRLYYEPGAVAEHFHPTDLARTLERMHGVGLEFRALCERVPEVPRPPRPAVRHRLKAAALAARLAIRPSGAAHEAAWRFLCDQVLREAYWGVPDGDGRPRTGQALARRALADPLANPPQPELPTSTTSPPVA